MIFCMLWVVMKLLGVIVDDGKLLWKVKVNGIDFLMLWVYFVSFEGIFLLGVLYGWLGIVGSGNFVCIGCG